jgi:hypothetical protein
MVGGFNLLPSGLTAITEKIGMLLYHRGGGAGKISKRKDYGKKE